MPTVHVRIAALGPHPDTRAPALERWIARADARASVSDWRAAAFRSIAPEAREVPAVASAALSTVSGGDRGAWAAMATPIHLIAGTSDVSLPPEGLLTLGPDEAEALVSDFNRLFADRDVRLRRVEGAGLICLFDVPLAVETTPPEALVGASVWEHLPRGPDSRRLVALSSEIEMWLFDSRINERRRLRSEPVVTGLWLWGGGRTDAAPPPVQGWSAGGDPLFAMLHRQGLYPGAERSGVSRSGVVVVTQWPGTAGWGDAERCWLEPAFADLEEARLEAVEISAARCSFRIGRRALYRFWRRSRPWWESFGLGEQRA